MRNIIWFIETANWSSTRENHSSKRLPSSWERLRLDFVSSERARTHTHECKQELREDDQRVTDRAITYAHQIKWTPQRKERQLENRLV